MLETLDRARWAGLSGSGRGDVCSPGRPFVFLHGLTFDHRMWEPVVAALPADRCALALDLPGHGQSALLAQTGLSPVVDAVHEAVLEAGLDRPVVVGHSIGGPLAAMYASEHPAAAVVSIDAPIRLEPFATMLRTVGPELAGDGFEAAWAGFRRSFQLERVPSRYRELLQAGADASQEVVLAYQADLLERPLADVVRRRDDGLRKLRVARTPYVSLHTNPPDPADERWLVERLPQAEVAVWPVGHHFPQLAHPARLATLLVGLAEAAR